MKNCFIIFFMGCHKPVFIFQNYIIELLKISLVGYRNSLLNCCILNDRRVLVNISIRWYGSNGFVFMTELVVL